MEKGYDIDITTAVYDEVANLWQRLESNTPTHIFLSWLWVGVWLKTYQPKVELLVVRYDGEVVALALLTRREVLRHGLFRSKILRFGRIGDQQQDQIWPEYGGVLLAKEHRDTVPAAIIQHLLSDSEWDEIELAAAPEYYIAGFHNTALKNIETWSAPAFGVDLRQLQRQGKNYLQSLSRNTRYQINRCKKRYAEEAALRFEVLKTPAEIEVVWPIMADLHRERWQHTPEKSGFSNACFVDFHTALLAPGCANGVVEFSVLHVGDRFLGGLYNFVYRGCVYFYLSCLVRERDAVLKPGLLLHSYAIEHYLQSGCEFYDFMGGDSQYKRSLGSKHCDLKTVYLQRERGILKIEQGLKQIKRLACAASIKSAKLMKRKGLKT